MTTMIEMVDTMRHRTMIENKVSEIESNEKRRDVAVWSSFLTKLRYESSVSWFWTEVGLRVGRWSSMGRFE